MAGRRRRTCTPEHRPMSAANIELARQESRQSDPVHQSSRSLAIGAARPPGWWRRRRSARPRRMRSGGRTRAANRPASSQSRPPHELSNGHIGQRLSEVGRVSCRVKPSFQLPPRPSGDFFDIQCGSTHRDKSPTSDRPSCRPEAPVATTQLSRLSGAKQRLRADSPS